MAIELTNNELVVQDFLLEAGYTYEQTLAMLVTGRGPHITHETYPDSYYYLYCDICRTNKSLFTTKGRLKHFCAQWIDSE